MKGQMGVDQRSGGIPVGVLGIEDGHFCMAKSVKTIFIFTIFFLFYFF
jgi:hypothetical protein